MCARGVHNDKDENCPRGLQAFSLEPAAQFLPRNVLPRVLLMRAKAPLKLRPLRLAQLDALHVIRNTISQLLDVTDFLRHAHSVETSVVCFSAHPNSL